MYSRSIHLFLTWLMQSRSIHLFWHFNLLKWLCSLSSCSQGAFIFNIWTCWSDFQFRFMQSMSIYFNHLDLERLCIHLFYQLLFVGVTLQITLVEEYFPPFLKSFILFFFIWACFTSICDDSQLHVMYTSSKFFKYFWHDSFENLLKSLIYAWNAYIYGRWFNLDDLYSLDLDFSTCWHNQIYALLSFGGSIKILLYLQLDKYYKSDS